MLAAMSPPLIPYSATVTRSTSSTVVAPASTFRSPAWRSVFMPWACAIARMSVTGAFLRMRLHLLADRHHLVDGHPALHPREAARRAAPPLVELRPAHAGEHVAVRQQRVLVHLVRLLAVLAHLAPQTLRHHQQQRRGDQERRDAHVDEPRDRRR